MAITGEELAGLLKEGGAQVSEPQYMKTRAGGKTELHWYYVATGANRAQTTIDVHGIYNDAAAFKHFDVLGVKPPSTLLPAATFDRNEVEEWLEQNGVDVGTRPRDDGMGVETVASRKGWGQRVVIPDDDKLSMITTAVLCMDLNVRYPDGLRRFESADITRDAFLDALRKQEGEHLQVEELPPGAGTRLTRNVAGGEAAAVTLPPDARFVMSDLVTYCLELRTKLPEGLPREQRVPEAPERAGPRVAEGIGNAVRGIFSRPGGAARRGVAGIVNDNNADRGEGADGKRDVRDFEQMKSDIEKEKEDPNHSDGGGHVMHA